MRRKLGRYRQRVTFFAALCLLALPCLCSGQTKINDCDGLAQRLLSSLSATDRSVLVMDLKDPDGQWQTFGAWLADQLSSSLAKRTGLIEVIERKRVAGALQERSLSGRDEFDPKTAVTLGRALGAQTVIIGSYGAIGTDVGVTLTAIRVSGNESDFVVVNGRIPLTQEVGAHLGVPLDSLRSKDGILRAGVGGITLPTCIKCPFPSMRVPDIDLRGLLRDKPHGGDVVLEFVVTPEGHATGVTVAKPIGYGVDEQYVKAAETFEFKPAVDPDDHPVSVHTSMSIHMGFK